MSQVQSGRLLGVVGTLQIAIIILVLVTAFVHLRQGLITSSGGPQGRQPAAVQQGRLPSAAPAQPRTGVPNRPPGGASIGFMILRLIPIPLSTLFFLNGISYLVLLTALYLPPLQQYRNIVRWLLIIFAIVTFVMYFLVVGFRQNPVGYVDKVVEATLIVLLLIDARQSARRPQIDFARRV